MPKPIHSSSVTISVFYHRESWHKLICDFFEPLLSEHKYIGNISDYFISLSTHQGDHIDVLIKKLSKEHGVIDRIMQSINQFLIEYPSSNPEIKYPTDFFFKNYDNNSCWLNVFNLPNLSRIQHVLCVAISGLLTTEVGNEIITVETLYIFTLYLQLSALNCFAPSMPVAKKMISILLPRIPVNQLNADLFGEIEISNITEVITDIWADDSSNVSWLNSWKLLLQKQITNFNYVKFSEITTSICIVTGFSQDLLMNSLYLFNKAFIYQKDIMN